MALDAMGPPDAEVSLLIDRLRSETQGVWGVEDLHAEAMSITTGLASGKLGLCEAMRRLKPLLEKLSATDSKPKEEPPAAGFAKAAPVPESARSQISRSSASSLANAALAKVRGVILRHARQTLDEGVPCESIHEAREAVASLTCLDDEPGVQRLFKAAQANLEKAKARCVAAEAAGEICEAIEERKQVRGQIASELRYGKRVGVVNLTELQELKERLRDLDEKINENLSVYKDVAGKKFKTAQCRNGTHVTPVPARRKIDHSPKSKKR